ncbi:MAG: hypothetical protein AAF518_18980 [Spirochaetota bacterium]
MSNLYLLITIGMGAGLIGVLIHQFGGSQEARLESIEAARQRFLLDFAGETIHQVWLSRDAKVAFLKLASSAKIGLVCSLGAMYYTRMVAKQDIKSIQRLVDGFYLDLYEVFFPKIHYFAQVDTQEYQDLLHYLQDYKEIY